MSPIIPRSYLRLLTWLFFGVLYLACVGRVGAIESLPTDNPKYQKIRKVYEDVARAAGNGRTPPRLVVAPVHAANRMKIAWSDAGTEGGIGVEGASGHLLEGYIAIEEKVYDLLAPFGDDRDNALAFLLGHELTHYYLRHGWVGDFGNAFASLEVGRKMQRVASYEQAVKLETEADYFGGFYGYLAGYNTLTVAPRVLEMLYAAYHMPDKIPNYPSRSDRVAIAARTEANLRKMVPIFDAGARLLVLERYEEAGRLFEHLAHTFPSPEMFNNAGVAYALEAIRLFPRGKLLFIYPFEYDAATRLRGKETRTRSIADDSEERRSRLLRKATESFEEALQREREYVPALANQAAVTNIQGDADTALLYASRAVTLAKRQNETQTLAAALVARGIALAESGERDRALMDFAAARNHGLASGTYNHAVLMGEKVAPTAAGSEADGPRREAIGGRTPRDLFVKDKGTASFTLQGIEAGQPAITIHSRLRESWEESQVTMGSRLLTMLATEHGYSGATARGINVGSPFRDVRDKYGEPTRLVPSRQGNSAVYQKPGIVFTINRDERVSGWMVYAIQ